MAGQSRRDRKPGGDDSGGAGNDEQEPRRRRSQRRNPGEGTLYQNAKGDWFASIGSGPDRRTVRIPKAEAGSAKARQRVLDQLREDYKRGRNRKAGRMSFHEFAEHWLNEIVDPGLKPKTIRFYRQILEDYLLPTLGDFQIELLAREPRHIQAWLNELRHDGGLSQWTVRHAYDVGRRVLKAARDQNYIPSNPFDAIKPPSVDEVWRPPLTSAHAAALLKTVVGHRLAPIYRLMLTLGLREGEALGLQRRDLVERDGKYILLVRRQLQELDGKLEVVNFTKSTPKGAAERIDRELPVPPRLLAELQAILPEAEDGLFFTSTRGTLVWPRNLMRHYRLALARAEAPTSYTIHDLRRTCGARLTDLNASQAIIAGVLGPIPFK